MSLPRILFLLLILFSGILALNEEGEEEIAGIAAWKFALICGAVSACPCLTYCVVKECTKK